MYLCFHEYTLLILLRSYGLLNGRKKHMLYEAGATYNEDSKLEDLHLSLTAVNHNTDLRNASFPTSYW